MGGEKTPSPQSIENDVEFSLGILRPKPGDFLVLTVPLGVPFGRSRELSRSIDTCLRTLGLHGQVKGVILRGEETLASVSPEQMAKLGWVRK